MADSPVTPPVADDELLACGTPVDELLAQVAEGRPPRDAAHQEGCPHCRATLAELHDVWAPVDELAADDVRAPADLLWKVMSRVRELSRNPWHAVVRGESGTVRVAARVVGAVAALAAESVPHVGSAFGQGRDGGPGDTPDVGVAGTHVVVDVHIAVDYGVPLHEVARQVREQIIRDLRWHTGLDIAEVNVRVVDVLALEDREV